MIFAVITGAVFILLVLYVLSQKNTTPNRLHVTTSTVIETTDGDINRRDTSKPRVINNKDVGTNPSSTKKTANASTNTQIQTDESTNSTTTKCLVSKGKGSQEGDKQLIKSDDIINFLRMLVNEIDNVQSGTKKYETCEITCPHCGHKKTEILPTEVCQIKYQCEKCQQILAPKGDDCCVYCTYSTHKCPSKQTQ